MQMKSRGLSSHLKSISLAKRILSRQQSFVDPFIDKYLFNRKNYLGLLALMFLKNQHPIATQESVSIHQLLLELRLKLESSTLNESHNFLIHQFALLHWEKVKENQAYFFESFGQKSKIYQQIQQQFHNYFLRISSLRAWPSVGQGNLPMFLINEKHQAFTEQAFQSLRYVEQKKIRLSKRNAEALQTNRSSKNHDQVWVTEAWNMLTQGELLPVLHQEWRATMQEMKPIALILDRFIDRHTIVSHSIQKRLPSVTHILSQSIDYQWIRQLFKREFMPASSSSFSAAISLASLILNTLTLHQEQLHHPMKMVGRNLLLAHLRTQGERVIEREKDRELESYKEHRETREHLFFNDSRESLESTELQRNTSFQRSLVLERSSVLQRNTSFQRSLVLERSPALQRNISFQRSLVLEGSSALQRNMSFQRNLVLEGSSALQGNRSFQRNLVLEGSSALQRNMSFQRILVLEGSSVIQRNISFQRSLALEGSSALQRNTSFQRSLVLEGSPALQRNTSFQRSLVLEGSSVIQRNTSFQRSLVLERSSVLQRNTSFQRSLVLERSSELQRNILFQRSPVLERSQVLQRNISFQRRLVLEGSSAFQRNISFQRTLVLKRSIELQSYKGIQSIIDVFSSEKIRKTEYRSGITYQKIAEQRQMDQHYRRKEGSNDLNDPKRVEDNKINVLPIHYFKRSNTDTSSEFVSRVHQSNLVKNDRRSSLENRSPQKIYELKDHKTYEMISKLQQKINVQGNTVQGINNAQRINNVQRTSGDHVKQQRKQVEFVQQEATNRLFVLNKLKTHENEIAYNLPTDSFIFFDSVWAEDVHFPSNQLTKIRQIQMKWSRIVQHMSNVQSKTLERDGIQELRAERQKRLLFLQGIHTEVMQHTHTADRAFVAQAHIGIQLSPTKEQRVSSSYGLHTQSQKRMLNVYKEQLGLNQLNEGVFLRVLQYQRMVKSYNKAHPSNQYLNKKREIFSKNIVHSHIAKLLSAKPVYITNRLNSLTGLRDKAPPVHQGYDQGNGKRSSFYDEQEQTGIIVQQWLRFQHQYRHQQAHEIEPQSDKQRDHFWEASPLAISRIHRSELQFSQRNVSIEHAKEQRSSVIEELQSKVNQLQSQLNHSLATEDRVVQKQDQQLEKSQRLTLQLDSSDFDLESFVDRVYRELEKKIEFEQQRRGLN